MSESLPIQILQEYLADLENHQADNIDRQCIEYVRAVIEGRSVNVSPAIKQIIEGDLKNRYNIDFTVGGRDGEVVTVRSKPQYDPTDGVEIQVYGDIVISITPENRKFTTALIQGGRPVFWTDSRTKPWLSDKIQNDFISQAYDRLDENGRLEKTQFKKKVHNAFFALREEIENNPKTKRSLTSPVVIRVNDATERVDAYPSEKTYYIVTVAEKTIKKEVMFTASEFAEMGSKASCLNQKWLNAFVVGPLDATVDDAREIRDLWLELAEIHENESVTEIDTVIEKLRIRCEAVRAFTDISLITNVEGDAYYDEKEEVVYVPSEIITTLLKELGKEHLVGRLSGEMRHLGYMVGPSKKKRLIRGEGPKRVWPIYPAFAKFAISDRERPPEVIDDVD